MVYLQTEQVLIPRQVYIADRAEIRCSFDSDADFLRKEVAQKGIVQLSLDSFTSELDTSGYEIKNMQIQSVGANKYTATITFSAWKTGNIQLPDYDIGKALGLQENLYAIKFLPEEIVSITQTQSISSLREINSPLLLPGTTYKIYGIAAFTVIFIIVLIRLIVKRNSVAFFIRNRILIHKYNKNKRFTMRKLLRLRDLKLKDSECATEIQRIMRLYLEFRFDYPFTRTVSSQMMKAFYNATKNLIDGKKETACEDISQIFIRTDFIRYSSDASFENDEKDGIIGRLLNDIEDIERVEDTQDKNMEDKVNA